MSLRVLMTTDTAGGVWVHALALCRALAPSNVEVRLLALGEASPAQRAEARQAGNIELVVRPVRLEWMPEPWPDLDALEPDLLRQADLGDCDVVHLNHLVHGHLDWQRPVICAVHSCVLSWFEAVRATPAPPLWQEYRRRVARSLRAADRVVAPSRWMLERAERWYGPLPGSSVIVNGSAAPLADPGAPRRGIIAAGRVWDDAKNLRPLGELATQLSAPVRIFGPPSSPDGQQASGDAAGDACGGELTQGELWAAMRGSRIFVAPALYEPFGLGILEAARSGCALVLGDIPTLRELWSDAALFVDPRRPQTWRPVLDDLLADDDRRLQLAAAARRRAADYTLERMARAYLALYRQSVDQPVESVRRGAIT
jgi:glycogen synthase